MSKVRNNTEKFRLDVKSKNPKLIYIRVDASIQIGSGHVERCLTLSKILSERDVKVHFICRSHIGHMAERIKSEGFGITMLPLTTDYVVEPILKEKYKSWLGASWELDAKNTSDILLKSNPIWLIVDHYAVDVSWEHLVKSLTNIKIMAIDGLANRSHDCDLLLDQTYSLDGIARWNDLIPSYCKLLSGAKYALLRPEFIKVKNSLRQRTGLVKRILIAFGGVDEINATCTALEAVISSNHNDIFIDVVIGKDNPHISQLKALCDKLAYVELHIQTSNIAELMAAADLSIGAGGTMVWERCYLGLPTLLISIAENQVKQAVAVQSFGAAIYIGVFKKDVGKKIVKELNGLLSNKKLNIAISKKALELMRLPDYISDKGATDFIVDTLLKT